MDNYLFLGGYHMQQQQSASNPQMQAGFMPPSPTVVST